MAKAPVSKGGGTAPKVSGQQAALNATHNYLAGLINKLSPTGPKLNAPSVPVLKPTPPAAPKPVDRITQLSMALQSPNSAGGQAARNKYLSPAATSGNNRLTQAQINATLGVKAAPPKTASTAVAKAAVKPKPAVVMPSHTTPTAFKPITNAPVGNSPGGVAPAKTGTPVGGQPAGNATKPGVNPFTGKATAAVDAELNPQTNAIQRALDALTGMHTSQVNDATALGQRQQGDLASLYERLGNTTQGLRNVQDSNFDSLGTKEQAAYDALKSQISSTYGNSAAGVNSELARLGISQVSPDATAALGRDSGYLTGLSGVNAANAQSNLASERGGFDSLMATLQGNAAASGAQHQSQASLANAKTLADLNSAFNTKSTDLMGQKTDIQATRGTKIQQMVDALTQQDTANTQAAQTADFNRELALSKLGISQGQLTLAQQKALSQAGLTQAQIKHLANSDSVAQQNANTNASKAATAAAKPKATPAIKPPTGLDGAMSILNGLAGPEKKDVINEFNTLLNGTYSDDLGPNGKPGVMGAGAASATDPVTVAHLNTWLKNNTSKNLTPADRDAILRALAAYNNKIGHA